MNARPLGSTALLHRSHVDLISRPLDTRPA